MLDLIVKHFRTSFMSSLHIATSISNEIGAIGEKIARDWLIQHNYAVLPIWGTWKDSDEYLRFKKDYSISPLGLGLMNDQFENEIKLTKKLFTLEEQKRLRSLLKDVEKMKRTLDLKHGRIYIQPDILARIPELTFIEVKVNDSQLRRGQKEFLDLARMNGFGTKIMRVSVQIVSEVIMKDIHF